MTTWRRRRLGDVPVWDLVTRPDIAEDLRTHGRSRPNAKRLAIIPTAYVVVEEDDEMDDTRCRPDGVGHRQGGYQNDDQPSPRPVPRRRGEIVLTSTRGGSSTIHVNGTKSEET